MVIAAVLLFVMPFVMRSIPSMYAQGTENAQTTENPQTVNNNQSTEAMLTDPCELDENNIYSDKDLSTEDIMVRYHEAVNEAFNRYIQTMLKAQAKVAVSSKPDPNSQPPANDVCTEENYSTYCVGKLLLTNQNYGYMAYRKALLCRKYELFDTTQERDAWNAYSDALVTGEANEQAVAAVYQTQKVVDISTRVGAIDSELENAKKALDATLAAYDELKTAWPLHQQYVELYNNLVKFRDKLAEIRHYTEELPAEFIDVTTSMCL